MVGTEPPTITQKPGTFRGHLRQVFWLIGWGVIIPCTITQGGIQTHGTIDYSHPVLFVSFHPKDTNNL